MLSMLIMYLRWILVYEPQMEKITDGIARLYFYGTYHPQMIDYMFVLLRELFIVALITYAATLIILAIDKYFEDEKEEIEETEEIYYKE